MKYKILIHWMINTNQCTSLMFIIQWIEKIHGETLKIYKILNLFRKQNIVQLWFLLLDSLGFESQQRDQIFLFSKMSRPDMGAHPTNYPTGTRNFSQRYSGRSVLLTNHLQLQPWLRMSGYLTYLYSPNMQSWRGQWKH